MPTTIWLRRAFRASSQLPGSSGASDAAVGLKLASGWIFAHSVGFPDTDVNEIAGVAFVAPNLCNDAHDCSLAQSDSFLQAFLPSVFNIFTMIARPGLSHVTSSTQRSHYGVLHTIEPSSKVTMRSVCAQSGLYVNSDIAGAGNCSVG